MARRSPSRPIPGRAAPASTQSDEGTALPVMAPKADPLPAAQALPVVEICRKDPDIFGQEPRRTPVCSDLSFTVPKGAQYISGREPGPNAQVQKKPVVSSSSGFSGTRTPPNGPRNPTHNLGNQAHEYPGKRQHSPQGRGGKRNVPVKPKPMSNSSVLDEILARAQLFFPDDTKKPLRELVPAAIVAPGTPRKSTLSGVSALWDAEVNDMLTAAATEGPRQSMPAAHPNPGLPGQTMRPMENPFPNTFPRSEWRRIYRPQGQGWYLEGSMRRDRELYQITAVPGEYRPVPPRHLQGFTRYIKSKDGGFWVRVVRKK